MCTSLPGGAVPAVGIPHVDKLVHFLLYAVLGMLVARAIVARPETPRGSASRAATLTVALAAMALFGAADEWHQRWVPGRSSDALDWCADMAGATIALLLVARLDARPEQLT